MELSWTIAIAEDVAHVAVPLLAGDYKHNHQDLRDLMEELHESA